MAFDPDKIAERVDRALVGAVEIDSSRFGLEIKNMAELQEVAKMFSLSKQAIPAYMRNEPGICYAILTRSVRWSLDPYFVAEQSYIVKNPKTGEEKIAFMSQLINAVVNKAEPLILEGKLRVKYEGAGDDMFAIVYGTPKGEVEPIEYKTPTIGQRIKAVGRNDSGYLKGSPLYDQDPEQALWYYGSRAFVRRYFPHVLGGAYSQEEMQEAGWERMKDITPQRPGSEEPKALTTLADRLKEKKANTVKKGRGFDPDHVERETAGNGGAKEDGASGDVDLKEHSDGGKTEDGGADAAGGGEGDLREGQRDASGGDSGDADDAVARGGADSGDREDAGPVAGGDATQAVQQELIPPGEEPVGRKRKR